MKDSVWNPFDHVTDSKQFLEVHKIISHTRQHGGRTGYVLEFMIDNQIQYQKRIRYNFWAALADVGGFHDGLFILFSFVLSPVIATLYENELIKGNLFSWKLNKRQKYDRS